MGDTSFVGMLNEDLLDGLPVGCHAHVRSPSPPPIKPSRIPLRVMATENAQISSLAVGTESLLLIRGVSAADDEVTAPAPLGEWGDVYWPLSERKLVLNGFRPNRSVMYPLSMTAPCK